MFFQPVALHRLYGDPLELNTGLHVLPSLIAMYAYVEAVSISHLKKPLSHIVTPACVEAKAALVTARTWTVTFESATYFGVDARAVTDFLGVVLVEPGALTAEDFTLAASPSRTGPAEVRDAAGHA
eukprot:gnl/Chilomastix_cuspidata/8567.p1 GENE.gnl/Chilomastix_cuspidata/8567~~gnl/Chilomastix_cuspidata/8567.p1  ORF type:complete len:126 (-),score=6.11 gnl/Chilomastix_cuspidata/8567:66-443(-)